MGIFSKKLNSDEYEKLYKKLIEVEGDLKILNDRIDNEITKNNSLRGLVNKKLGSSAIEEEDDLGEPIKTVKKSDAFDNLRKSGLI